MVYGSNIQVRLTKNKKRSILLIHNKKSSHCCGSKWVGNKIGASEGQAEVNFGRLEKLMV